MRAVGVEVKTSKKQKKRKTGRGKKRRKQVLMKRLEKMAGKEDENKKSEESVEKGRMRCYFSTGSLDRTENLTEKGSGEKCKKDKGEKVIKREVKSGIMIGRRRTSGRSMN